MVLLQLVVVSAWIGFGSAHTNTVDLVSAAVATTAVKCLKETTSVADCYPPSPNFPGPTEELCPGLKAATKGRASKMMQCPMCL
ncbi:unnamed protein product [Peronospora destructor]|uniref:Secreted protein n=1 Tax=Peronospora destructor TaxID=86335 RepID=A0AAV0UZS2_9STRA|nr:unnamed protein product [Peronospora destructor]